MSVTCHGAPSSPPPPPRLSPAPSLPDPAVPLDDHARIAAMRATIQTMRRSHQATLSVLILHLHRCGPFRLLLRRRRGPSRLRRACSLALTPAPAALGSDETSSVGSVQARSAANRMTTSNLAVLFGPTLMRSGQGARDLIDIGVQARTVAFLITHALEIFDETAYDAALASPTSVTS